MKRLEVYDVISGGEGRAYAILDGNKEELFYAKSIEATATKQKNTFGALGRRQRLSKANGAELTGNLTMYYCTSVFRKAMIDYIKTGKDLYFDLVVENNDDTSTRGSQVIILKNVNLDSTVLTKLDIDSTELDEEMSFTFDDVDMDSEFND